MSTGCCIGPNKYIVFNSDRSLKNRTALKMFKNVTDFFGIYKSNSNYDRSANGRMVFIKEDSGPISKVIRFDVQSRSWSAANEAVGTNPKPFWYSTRKEDQCVAKSGMPNLQIW